MKYHNNLTSALGDELCNAFKKNGVKEKDYYVIFNTDEPLCKPFIKERFGDKLLKIRHASLMPSGEQINVVLIDKIGHSYTIPFSGLSTYNKCRFAERAYNTNKVCGGYAELIDKMVSSYNKKVSKANDNNYGQLDYGMYINFENPISSNVNSEIIGINTCNSNSLLFRNYKDEYLEIDILSINDDLLIRVIDELEKVLESKYVNCDISEEKYIRCRLLTIAEEITDYEYTNLIRSIYEGDIKVLELKQSRFDKEYKYKYCYDLLIKKKALVDFFENTNFGYDNMLLYPLEKTDRLTFYDDKYQMRMLNFGEIKFNENEDDIYNGKVVIYEGKPTEILVKYNNDSEKTYVIYYNNEITAVTDDESVASDYELRSGYKISVVNKI